MWSVEDEWSEHLGVDKFNYLGVTEGVGIGRQHYPKLKDIKLL